MGTELLALPFGIAIGLLLGLVGGGGSILAVPALVYVLGQPVHAATNESLFIVGIAALAGAAGHARAGNLSTKTALTFGIAGAAGSLGGTAGVLTGFFGVGGGFVIVPALVLLLGVPIRRAIGTSLAIMALTSAAALAAHLATGQIA